MAGTRGQNTMMESLRALLSQIAEMKATPDADIAYLTNLETQVLKYLRAPFERQLAERSLEQGGQPQLGQQGPGPTEQLLFGNAAQGGGGGLAALLGGGGQRVPGVMQAPQMPNGNELRRLMAQPSL